MVKSPGHPPFTNTRSVGNSLRTPKPAPSLTMASHAPRRKLGLMMLPVEVREVIYQHVFRYRRPLYTARSGRLIIDQEARRDMQCLRTCIAFYCEAMPQIYAINILEISYDQMQALAGVPRQAEILVGKVVIHCRRHQPLLRDEGMEVEEIDFGLLGYACPNVTSVVIHTYSSGSLLWVTQKLSKSLPCSTIREWPLLRVDVKISEDDPRFDNANFAKRSGAIIHGINPSRPGFSWLNARSGFRLGYEMPRHLKTLQVVGKLSKRLCWVLLDCHSCTFGDCSFQKEKLVRDTTSSSTDGSAERFRYTWHKTGKYIAYSLHMYTRTQVSRLTMSLQESLFH
jgi:hypothetical protein